MECFKLTDAEMKTWEGFQWRLGVRHDEPADRPRVLRLRNKGCLHAFVTPEVAALMAPFRAPEGYTRLFRAQVDGEIVNDGTQIGARSMKLVEEVDYPRPDSDQRVYFAIRAVRDAARRSAVALSYEWEKWADRWIQGSDLGRFETWDSRGEGPAKWAGREETILAVNAPRGAATEIHWAANWAASAGFWAWGARSAARPPADREYRAELAAVRAADAGRCAAAAGADLIPLAREAMEWTA
jgi:hypothetical protein